MTPDPIHDDDAELALLRCCFTYQEQIDRVSDLVHVGDWFVEAHRMIWQAMLAVHKDGADVDAVTLHTELTRIGRWNVAGGAAYLDTLLDAPALRDVASCAERVASLARRRDLYLDCKRAAILANDPTATREEVAAAIERLRTGWDCGGMELPTQTAAEIDRLEWPDTPEWLIGEWLGIESCSFLAAFEKSSKTVIAIGMALSVATGTPWLGRFPVQRGPVLAVLEEDHVRRVQRRLRKIGNALQLDWRTNDLHIAAQQGCNICTERGRGRLLARIRRVKPILLICDPFRRITPGLEEKDSGAVAGVLGWCRQVQRENHCAVMILDHKRKESSTGADQGREAHQLRGSGDKGAWVDDLIVVRRKSEESPEHKVRAFHRDASPLPEQLVMIVWDSPNKGDLFITSNEVVKQAKATHTTVPVHDYTESRGEQRTF